MPPRNIIKFVVTACFIFFSFIISAMPARVHAADTQTLLAKSYAQKEISDTDYIFYQIQSAFAPDKLPAKYKSFEMAKPRRDITLFLLAAMQNFNRFTPEQQTFLKSVFARPTDAGDTYAYTAAEAAPYCTTHFCIHYVTSTADAPPSTDTSPANSIPDYVEFMGQEFEVVYDKENGAETSGLGYTVPPTDGSAGGDSKFDVYIKNIGANSLFGFAQPETQTSSTPVKYTSYMAMDNDYSAAEFSSYGGDYTKPVRVTAAHEYHHAIQFGYFGNGPSWFFESTATWAEDEVYDTINDNYSYMTNWFKYPQVSLDIASSTAYPSPDDTDKLHVYGSWVFMRYISEKYAKNIVRKFWETAGTSCNTSNADTADNRLCTLNAMDTVLSQNNSTTLAAVFADFAARNYIKSGSDGIYKEGASYPNVTLTQTHTTFPVSTQTNTLDHLGSRYFQFTAPDTNNNALTISFNGPDSKKFAAKIILVTSGGTLTEDSITLDAASNDGTYQKSGFGSTYSKIILVAVNTGKIATDGSTDSLSFSYSASNAAFSSPSAPTNVSATAGDAQVALSWTAATAGSFSIASYNVYRAATSGGTQTKINTSVVTSTSYTDTGLTNGTTYFYVVKAWDSAGNESSASSEVSATPAASSTTTAPSAPTGVSASAGDTQATISWSSVSGATSYNIYMAEQTGVTASNYSSLTGGMKHTGVTSPYTHTGITNGTKYYFIVTAVNSVGESSASSEVNATPFAKPSAPSGVTATAGDAKVTLSWTATTKTTYDISSYNVYRSATTGTGYAKINSSAVTSTSYSDSIVTNGTPYFYVVTAVDSQSNESANSSEVNATPAADTTTTTTETITLFGEQSLGFDGTNAINTLKDTSKVPEGASITIVPNTPSAKVILAGKVNPDNPGGAKLKPAVILISVEVYALNGNRVAAATTTANPEGFYVTELASDFSGRPLANGVYACRTVILADGVVVKQTMSKIVVYR